MHYYDISYYIVICCLILYSVLGISGVVSVDQCALFDRPSNQRLLQAGQRLSLGYYHGCIVTDSGYPDCWGELYSYKFDTYLFAIPNPSLAHANPRSPLTTV
jgi:hypothetical protein